MTAQYYTPRRQRRVFRIEVHELHAQRHAQQPTLAKMPRGHPGRARFEPISLTPRSGSLANHLPPTIAEDAADRKIRPCLREQLAGHSGDAA